MNRCLLLVHLLAIAAVSGFGSVAAAPVNYKLPEETAAFKPGPNLEVVQNNAPPATRPTISTPSRAAPNSRRISGRPR
jgi:hypothetical protein